MSTVLTETVALLECLGHDLDILQILEKIFEEDTHMDEELMEMFIDIIYFWTTLIHFLRRQKGKLR